MNIPGGKITILISLDHHFLALLIKHFSPTRAVVGCDLTPQPGVKWALLRQALV